MKLPILPAGWGWAIRALALVIFIGLVYLWGRKDGGNACLAEQARQDAQEAALAAARVRLTASAAATARAEAQETLPRSEEETHAAHSRVEIIYRDRPVAADCSVPDGVRHELDEAVKRVNQRVRSGTR